MRLLDRLTCQLWPSRWVLLLSGLVILLVLRLAAQGGPPGGGPGSAIWATCMSLGAFGATLVALGVMTTQTHPIKGMIKNLGVEPRILKLFNRALRWFLRLAMITLVAVAVWLTVGAWLSVVTQS
jgi:hypothetical protein